MSYIISGIQQVGIGNTNVHEAFAWYNKNFGMDIPMLNEDAEATQMLPYTGGKGHKRHAILAINLKGGGGFEIWQYKSRVAQPCPFTVEVADLGFTIAKMKTENIDASYRRLKNNGVQIITPITVGIDGRKHFYLKDLYGNTFEMVEFQDWFYKGMLEQGGPCGMVIGVSDINRSMKFYSAILGYDNVVAEKEGIFEDWKGIDGAEQKVRRVILKHSKPRAGSFSRLLGNSFIELVQFTEKQGRKIFDNRFWGDQGFIHFCFDIKNMQALKQHCTNLGHPFTVESNPDFDMGEAAGQFAYIEDPDGALIEFVETHKIPIMKKIGWYLHLNKKDPSKPLPDWMLKTLRFSRVKIK
jgi:catechol 2,3-dioxygenase-like lactoylglutathione lyase family enzyme